jgi:hypothetical protein
MSTLQSRGTKPRDQELLGQPCNQEASSFQLYH